MIYRVEMSKLRNVARACHEFEPSAAEDPSSKCTILYFLFANPERDSCHICPIASGSRENGNTHTWNESACLLFAFARGGKQFFNAALFPSGDHKGEKRLTVTKSPEPNLKSVDLIDWQTLNLEGLFLLLRGDTLRMDFAKFDFQWRLDVILISWDSCQVVVYVRQDGR
ncbi:hypothetical protein TNCV_3393621 [Trichonephila clavipes]|nr:hypothetical protein TNCV_3393621 [Trichonephila clavipes]